MKRRPRTAVALLCLALASPRAAAVRHPPAVDDDVAPTTSPASPSPPPASTSLAAPTSASTTSASTTPRRSPLRVAVYDLGVSGDVDARVGRIVTDAFVVELRKLQGVSVVSLDEVRALVAHEATRQAAGCVDDSCLAEVADALGVDVLVTGSLSTLGAERVIVVRRLSTTDATAAATATRNLVPAEGEEFLAAVGPVVAQLFADHPLQAGRARGVDQRIALLLNPPPLPIWTTVAVAAGAFVAGAGAAVTATALSARQDEFHRRQSEAKALDRELAGAQLVAVRNDGVALATSTNVLVGAALVLGVAGAVMAPWTDWAGVADDDAP